MIQQTDKTKNRIYSRKKQEKKQKRRVTERKQIIGRDFINSVLRIIHASFLPSFLRVYVVRDVSKYHGTNKGSARDGWCEWRLPGVYLLVGARNPCCATNYCTGFSHDRYSDATKKQTKNKRKITSETRNPQST